MNIEDMLEGLMRVTVFLQNSRTIEAAIHREAEAHWKANDIDRTTAVAHIETLFAMAGELEAIADSIETRACKLNDLLDD